MFRKSTASPHRGEHKLTSKSLNDSIRIVKFGSAPRRLSKESESTLEEKDSFADSRNFPDSDPLTYLSWNERMRHREAPVDILEEPLPNLESLQCIFVIVMLTRCTDALSLIRAAKGIPYVDQNLEYIPTDEKYEYQEFYELEAITNNTLEDLTFAKFEKDISWLEKALRKSIESLRQGWNSNYLATVIQDYYLMREDEDVLLMAKNFNQSELAKLRLCEEAERNHLVKCIQEVTEKLGYVKDQLNDKIVEDGIKMRFLKSWEQARDEQNKMILKEKEVAYQETAKTMSIQIERESRVHEEMEMYLKGSIEDYQQEIEDWMVKYDEDMDDFDIRLGKMKIVLEQQRDMTTELQLEFDLHKQFIEEYTEYKLKKLQEEQEEARRNEAAIKIQFWWRDIMIRNCLGPYRKKKGKGKKKNSGKNSGKKKKK